MAAYLLNNYYIFTNYNDLSAHIHDVVHFAEQDQQTSGHGFSIITGEVHWDKMIFVDDKGLKIPMRYEREYDFYYSILCEANCEDDLKAAKVP